MKLIDDNVISTKITSQYEDYFWGDENEKPFTTTIYFFKNDSNMTKGSIYSFLRELKLDSNGLLYPIMLEQIMYTYERATKKCEPILSQFLPHCISSIICDYQNHDEEMFVQYEQV